MMNGQRRMVDLLRFLEIPMGRTHQTRSVLLLLFCLVMAGMVAADAQNSVAPTTERTYPDSAEGLQSQVSDIISVAGSNDHAAIRSALDSLGVPNADKCFGTHFDPRFQVQLPGDYAKALSAYQSHISWVAVNFAKFNDFALKVQPSEIPKPLADSGFESLLPRPVDAVKIENYRFTSTASDPNTDLHLS